MIFDARTPDEAPTRAVIAQDLDSRAAGLMGYMLSSFTAVRTDAVALSCDLIGRLAKLGKIHGGAPLVWRFGGREKVASVMVDSEPPVSGLVMPVRWMLDDEEPGS